MADGFPAQPEELAPAWLTGALRGSGRLAPDRAVSSVAVTPVGMGILGQVVRIHAAYDGGSPGAEPPTIVAKFAHPLEANRAIAMNTRMYEREVRFFNEIADRVAVPKPACYHAAVDTVTGENVVLLEDLGAYRAGDQVDGVTVDEARAIIDAVAPLHAAFWGRGDDAALADAMRIDSSYIEPFLPGLMGTWERAVAEFPHRIAPEVLPHVPRYVQAVGDLMRHMGTFPQTLVHGDVRLDNVMFGDGGEGRHPVMLIDWQAVMVSNPLQDLGYLLSQSLPVEARRAHERELVEHYHTRLVEHGVTGFDLAACWDAYDVAVLTFFCYPLIIAGVSVPDDPRSVALADAVLERSSAAVADRGLLAILDRL